MSGAGNTASGATIFSENTTSGGPNDVTVANLRVEQDMRVDGNFQVGTFSIDDLTVNDDLNVTDELTVGGNTYAQFLETASDINCKGNLLVEDTIVADGVASLNGGIAVATDKFTVAPVTGNTVIKGTLQVDGGITGIASGTVEGAMQYRSASGDFAADDSFVYTPATKRLRVGDGTANTADMLPTAVTVADASGEGTLYHNRVHLSDPTNAHVARVRLNGSTMEVGPNTATTLALQTGGTTRATVDASTGQVQITTGLTSSNTTTGALVITGAGGLGVGGRANIGGNTAILSTTQSTSTLTGALVVSGGVGIAKQLRVGEAVEVGPFPGFGPVIADSYINARANPIYGFKYYGVYKSLVFEQQVVTDPTFTFTGDEDFREMRIIARSLRSSVTAQQRLVLKRGATIFNLANGVTSQSTGTTTNTVWNANYIVLANSATNAQNVTYDIRITLMGSSIPAVKYWQYSSIGYHGVGNTITSSGFFASNTTLFDNFEFTLSTGAWAAGDFSVFATFTNS